MVLPVRKFWLTLLLLSCWVGARAAGPDSTAVLESRFNRIGINTFSWRSALLGTDSLNDRHLLQYRLHQDHLYNSALVTNRLTREDYLADLRHTWQFRRRITLKEQFFYQNSRASFTEIGSLTEHLYYEPVPLLNWAWRSSVFAGLRHDARLNRADKGPEFGGQLSGGITSKDGSETFSGNVFFSQANLNPRTFQRLVTDARYEEKFDAGSALQVRTEYRRNRNEDYLGNHVQRIQSDTLATFLTGSYTISDKLSFRSNNQLLLPDRAFSYRNTTEAATPPAGSRYKQFDLETVQEFLVQLPKLRGNLAASYKERNRTYKTQNSGPDIKDIQQKTTTWVANATYLFSDRHSLTSQNQGELLRVDTPSDQNAEDRDEVFYQSRLLFSSRWLPFFRTGFALVGAYKQYVFIKAAQSAENYTERSLTYEPSFNWAPGRFSWEAQLQLQANYQVRAFVSEQLKNRANRAFNQNHLLRYEAGRDLLFQGEYIRRENRLGLLNWEQFTESPLDSTISNTVAFSVKKGLRGKRGAASLRVGYRYFEQQTKGKAGLSATGQPTTLIYLHQVTRQQGPEFRLETRNYKGLQLEAGLWLQRLHNFKTYRQTNQTFLGTTYTPEDLAASQKKWYPYFDVSMHWAFRVSRYGKRSL